MSRILFRNAMVWDGTGAEPFPGDVLVEGNRIRTVARKSGQLPTEGAQVVDGTGCTLMPGMTEGHAHISFGGAVKNSDLGDIPPEEHVLLTMRNAKLLLEHGFTSRVQRGQREAAARCRHPQRDRGGAAAGPAASRGGAGADGHGRLGRRAAAAHAPRELRHHRRRGGRDGAGGAHLLPRGRGQHQDEHLGRRLRPVRPRRPDRDERDRGRDRGRGRA